MRYSLRNVIACVLRLRCSGAVRYPFSLTSTDGQAERAKAPQNLHEDLDRTTRDLDRVRRIVKLNGYIACAPDFTEHPEVLNGASNLLGEIFGDRGVHARAAVGVTSLPRGVPVEIDLVVEIDPFGFPDKSN